MGITNSTIKNKSQRIKVMNFKSLIPHSGIYQNYQPNVTNMNKNNQKVIPSKKVHSNFLQKRKSEYMEKSKEKSKLFFSSKVTTVNRLKKFEEMFIQHINNYRHSLNLNSLN